MYENSLFVFYCILYVYILGSIVNEGGNFIKYFNIVLILFFK